MFAIQVVEQPLRPAGLCTQHARAGWQPLGGHQHILLLHHQQELYTPPPPPSISIQGAAERENEITFPRTIAPRYHTSSISNTLSLSLSLLSEKLFSVDSEQWCGYHDRLRKKWSLTSKQKLLPKKSVKTNWRVRYDDDTVDVTVEPVHQLGLQQRHLRQRC